MAKFLTPTDIGSRALQYIGAEMLDPTLGFSTPGKNARQVSFVYDKLRRAELQQNAWEFAVRKAVLRPVDANTCILAPALWVQSTTYFKGSLVVDENNIPWQSKIRNNLGNQPGVVLSAWEPYFGPLSVSLYDSAIMYFSSECVYTTAGNGTYNVFKSLQDGNVLHPALPDQWLISAGYSTNQVVQRFPNWSNVTTYAKGNGVLYTDGNVYVSLTNSNTGSSPPSTNWQLMPFLQLATPVVPANGTQPQLAPLTSPILEWSSSTGYSIGNFVIFNATVYMSIVNTNTGNYPNASGSTSWVAVTNGTTYMSLIDFNIGNDPVNSPANWAVGTTYATGNQVNGSNGLIYTSKSNGNVGHDPTLDVTSTYWTNTGVLTPWTTVFTLGSGNDYWIQIGGSAFPSGVSITPLQITWPVGSGPVSQSSTRNVFRLPANFLRPTPRDETAGDYSPLGAPSNLIADDWEYKGDFLTSWLATPIVFPFVADVFDVSTFHDMFCEGLSARIGLAVIEPITQNLGKRQACASEYKMFMGLAKLQNAILIGSDQPPLDDFILCRN